jgi:hypothetical protein
LTQPSAHPDPAAAPEPSAGPPPAASPASSRVRAAVLGALGLAAAGWFLHVVPVSYPVSDWLLWRYLAFWLAGAVFTAASVSIGHLVLDRLFRVRDLPLLATLVLAEALGLAVYALVFYAAGAVALLDTGFALLYPVAAIALGGPALFRKLRTAWQAHEPASPSHPIAVAATVGGVLALGIVYLGILTPEAIGYDGAWQHLPIAEAYARNGRIVPFPADWAKNHPHLTSLIHTWGYLLPGFSAPERWILALHQEFVLFLFTLAGVAALVRELCGRPVRAAWAGFFLFPAIFVYDCNLQGSADHVLAFFAIPVFLAALRAGRSLARRDLLLVGALVGAAALVKYQAIFLGGAAAIPLAVGWLGAVRRRWRGEDAPTARELVLAPLLAAGAAVLVLSPHLVRNAIFYGNPFYPYLQASIPSHPTVADADVLVRRAFAAADFRPRGNFLERVLDTLQVWLTFSWKAHYAGWSKEIPIFGALFTLLLPVGLLLPRPRGRILLALGGGAMAILCWAGTYRLDRNLQSSVPLLAAATVAVLVRAWEAGKFARVGIVPLVLLQLAWSSDAVAITQSRQLAESFRVIRAGFDGQRGDEVWSRSLRDYRSVNDALPADAKVVLHYHQRSLGIDREVLQDWVGYQSLFDARGYRSPRQLWDAYRAQGVTHVLTLPNDLPAATRGEDVIFALLQQSTSARRFGPLRLDTLPESPPPDPERPIEVVALGIWGYADGLYPVEAMTTHEGVPHRFQRFPPPEAPLPADDGGRLALLSRAQAVFVGKGAGLAGALEAEVKRSFQQAASFQGGSLQLYLRRTVTASRAVPRFRGPVAVDPSHAE